MGNDNIVLACGMTSGVYYGDDLTVKFAADISGFSSVWDWIQTRIQAASFIGLKIGDYIPLVAGGYTIKAEIAGIDTYYGAGNPMVQHHIDFISRDCWPVAHAWNKVDFNNGTIVSPHPWLASDIYAWLNSLAMNVPNGAIANPPLGAVNYTTTGVFDKLPAMLKNIIAEKWVVAPKRYETNELLVDDNDGGFINIGKLWLPSEFEVCNFTHWGTKKNGYSSCGFQQYPIFANNMKRIKGESDGGERIQWWMLSAVGGSSTNCVYSGVLGMIMPMEASYESFHAPVCFRIS